MAGAAADAPPRTTDAGRARQPDETGVLVRDGVRIAWERFGAGSPTVLLMPSWSLFPSRFWKFQVPFLARSFRVVTFDGRGSGRSDAPSDPTAYADTVFADDAAAVLDANGVEDAIAVGLSMGAGYAIQLAVRHPERVRALALIGSSLSVLDRPAGTPDEDDDAWFDEPRDADDDDGWGRYNGPYWRRDWPAFVDWFVGTRIFSEPHSTKAIEDGIRWGNEPTVDTMLAIQKAPYLRRPAEDPVPPTTEGRSLALIRRVRQPALVIHGTADRIAGIAVGRRLAAELMADFVELQGAGHAPLLRDPVVVNLALRSFIRRFATDRDQEDAS